MDELPYIELSKGSFLVATPEIEQGIFSRSVILLCEHTPNGSFGLVINKTLELELPDEVIKPEEIVNPHIGIRSGGPVQSNQMMLLHSSDEIPQQTLEICDGVYLGGDLQFLHESAIDEYGPHVRLCFGYAGWGVGQLEREFLDGSWFIHPGSAEHVFNTPVEQVWQNVLREMGGKYASFAMIPEDLTLN